MKKYINNRGMVEEADLVDAMADYALEDWKEKRIEAAIENETPEEREMRTTEEVF